MLLPLAHQSLKTEWADYDNDTSELPLLGRSSPIGNRARGTWIRRPLRLFCILLGVLTTTFLYRYIRTPAAPRSPIVDRYRSAQSFAPAGRVDLAATTLGLANLSAHELIDHPLLTSHRYPNCTLSPSQITRYAPLSPSFVAPHNPRPHFASRSDLTYLIAINLFNSQDVLPSLIRALTSVFLTLGPPRFHLSIYENGSEDATPSQLLLFSHLLSRLGVGYTIISDPAPHAWEPFQRIPGLARIRNKALAPLLEAPAGTFDRVIFLNDVVMCEADLFEILFQHEVQTADMSCGMDWKELKIKEFEPDYPTIFYDVWVARDILGL